MTNTLYFDGIVRDDASTTTSSSDVSLQQLPSTGQASSSSSLYKVIGKAITALIPWRSGSGSAFNRNIHSVGGASPAFAQTTMEESSDDSYMELDDSPRSGIRVQEQVYATHRPECNGAKSLSSLKYFLFKELETATTKFCSEILGSGCSGTTFKGWIDEQTLAATKPGRGIAVAIKHLNISVLGDTEWLMEVKLLGSLSHPNLVRLLGCCLENRKRLVVSEFIPGGSLEDHLFKSNSFPLLSWSLRLKVALGAAKGLAFLHRAKIVHGNIRSSNILVELNYNAKLSDFGFVRDDSRLFRPCPGYTDPAYAMTGFLTTKCDVYSFGVVLLEIILGRRAFEKLEPTRKYCIVDWCKTYLREQSSFYHFLDIRYDGQYPRKTVFKLAFVCFACIAENAKQRPEMDEVVTALEFVITVLGKEQMGIKLTEGKSSN